MRNKLSFRVEERELEDEKSVMIWIIDNQMARRNIESAARISLALVKEGLLRDEAEDRKKDSQFQKSNKVPPDLADRQTLFEKGDVRDIIAKDAGVSHGTVDKFLYIEKHDPELAEKIVKGESDKEGKRLTIDGGFNKTKTA
jgi:hypothetical protein